MQLVLQIGYAWWNFKTLFENVEDVPDLEEPIDASSHELVPIGPTSEQGELT